MNATVLVELTSADQAAGMERCFELAGKALAMPDAFRLDGRALLRARDGGQWRPGDVSDVRGWQFGPLIGGLGVTPGKADYFPGEIRSLSVCLR